MRFVGSLSVLDTREQCLGKGEKLKQSYNNWDFLNFGRTLCFVRACIYMLPINKAKNEI